MSSCWTKSSWLVPLWQVNKFGTVCSDELGAIITEWHLSCRLNQSPACRDVSGRMREKKNKWYTKTSWQQRTNKSQVRLIYKINNSLWLQIWRICVASESAYLYIDCLFSVHVDMVGKMCVQASVYLQHVHKCESGCGCMSHWLIPMLLQPCTRRPGRPGNKHTVILWPWISASRLICRPPPRALQTHC